MAQVSKCNSCLWFNSLIPSAVHAFVSSDDNSQQKVVLRVPTMTDDKIKQKAIEAVADIYGNILYHPLSSLAAET
jgi:predicted 3-demethylubiquinone-9 3-methyltransferase (glyoxalase superfamily)